MKGKNGNENNLEFNILGDSIKTLSDSMSNFRTSVPSINDSIRFNNFQPYSFYTSEKSDKEKIVLLERKVAILEGTISKNYINEGKQAEDVNKSINLKVDAEIKNIEPKINSNIKKNVDDKMIIERNNIIGSLSLFVAFFTFISINVTIFSKVDDIFTALILMFGMIISISIMLMIFFLFLTHKTGDKIIQNQLFLILCGLIIINILALCYFNDNKTPLSPSIKDNIENLQEENKNIKINLDEKINSLKTESKTLRDNLEQQILKEVQFQLLKQQPKTSSN